MSEENNTPKWYVVHTYSGYENKVMTSLQNMVGEYGAPGQDRGCAHSH